MIYRQDFAPKPYIWGTGMLRFGLDVVLVRLLGRAWRLALCINKGLSETTHLRTETVRLGCGFGFPSLPPPPFSPLISSPLSLHPATGSKILVSLFRGKFAPWLTDFHAKPIQH